MENHKVEISQVDLIITEVKSQTSLKSKELQSEVFMSLW